MSEGNEQDAAKGRLSLRPAGRMELGRTVDAGSVRQSFSHGRSKVVQVEVRKKRAPGPTPPPGAPATSASGSASGSASAPAAPRPSAPGGRPGPGGRALTANELAVRQRVLLEQQRDSARRDAERRDQRERPVAQRRAHAGGQSGDAAAGKGAVDAENVHRPHGRGDNDADQQSLDEERQAIHALAGYR